MNVGHWIVGKGIDRLEVRYQIGQHFFLLHARPVLVFAAGHGLQRRGRQTGIMRDDRHVSGGRKIPVTHDRIWATVHLGKPFFGQLSRIAQAEIRSTIRIDDFAESEQ